MAPSRCDCFPWSRLWPRQPPPLPHQHQHYHLAQCHRPHSKVSWPSRVFAWAVASSRCENRCGGRAVGCFFYFFRFHTWQMPAAVTRSDRWRTLIGSRAGRHPNRGEGARRGGGGGGDVGFFCFAIFRSFPPIFMYFMRVIVAKCDHPFKS